MKVAQELKEAQVSRQVQFADAPKHSQIRLEQGEQALRPIFVHVTPRVFFLSVIDERMHVALYCPIAVGRIGIQATARLDREVGPPGAISRFFTVSRSRFALPKSILYHIL